jgi:hypothetical protein
MPAEPTFGFVQMPNLKIALGLPYFGPISIGTAFTIHWAIGLVVSRLQRFRRAFGLWYFFHFLNLLKIYILANKFCLNFGPRNYFAANGLGRIKMAKNGGWLKIRLLLLVPLSYLVFCWLNIGFYRI